MAGNFRKRVSPTQCTVADFYNPWTFHGLFLKKNKFVLEWMKNNGLLAQRMVCEVCGDDCVWTKRKHKHHGYTWRCRRKGDHEKEYSIAKYSFFDHSHFVVQDIMEFIRTLLLGGSLKGCSVQAGMDYKKTSVDWVNFVRNPLKKFINSIYNIDDPIKSPPSFFLATRNEGDESLISINSKVNVPMEGF